MGSIASGGMGQTVGAQIGGMSNVLLHSGTFCPFVHRQTQSALASENERNAPKKSKGLMALRMTLMLLLTPSVKRASGKRSLPKGMLCRAVYEPDPR